MSSPIMRVSIFRFSVTTAFRFNNLGRQHLLAAEGQQLAGQRSGAIGGVGDLLGRAAQRGVGADALQQELGVPGDHHQQIVEVVGDAAGEAADGFHLLRLAELLFEGAALGDVFGEKFEEDGVAFVADGAAGEADADGCCRPCASSPRTSP